MNLPETFKENIRLSLGDGNAACLFDALQDEPATGVRFNPAKTDGASFLSHFGQYGPSPIGWADCGFTLSRRPSFTADPLFHAGAYYVQEPSSMVVGKIAAGLLDGTPRPVVLDLCAAPGGKSTDILSHLTDDALLVSNEVMRQRATVLAENIAKWGRPNCIVCNSDPSDFKRLPPLFDLVAVDAPCSGEGMFRKDEEALAEWSADTVNLCAARQRRILADVWDSLKPGGYLIFSTCTFNSLENDGNVLWLESEFKAERVSPGEAPEGVFVTPAGGWQFIPGRVRGEGFFLAVLRKPSQGTDAARMRISPARCGETTACDWVTEGNVILRKGDLLKAVPAVHRDMTSFLESRLKVIRSGIAVATVKGKDLIPEADLALSTILRRGAFPEAPLDLETALDFLSRNPITTPGAPLGYVLTTFEGLPLGFVKNLGNRTNSLHPVARRIKNSYICKTQVFRNNHK